MDKATIYGAVLGAIIGVCIVAGHLHNAPQEAQQTTIKGTKYNIPYPNHAQCTYYVQDYSVTIVSHCEFI